MPNDIEVTTKTKEPFLSGTRPYGVASILLGCFGAINFFSTPYVYAPVDFSGGGKHIRHYQVVNPGPGSVSKFALKVAYIGSTRKGFDIEYSPSFDLEDVEGAYIGFSHKQNKIPSGGFLYVKITDPDNTKPPELLPVENSKYCWGSWSRDGVVSENNSQSVGTGIRNYVVWITTIPLIIAGAILIVCKPYFGRKTQELREENKKLKVKLDEATAKIQTSTTKDTKYEVGQSSDKILQTAIAALEQIRDQQQ
jgi:hypothetical protein